MWKSIAIGVFILFFVLLTFLPRLSSLSLHWASDEKLWMERSRDFFFALQTGRFSDTAPVHHPGVTTCWLGSFAIWKKHWRDSFPKSWFDSDEFLSPEMLASVRFPIAVVTGVLVLVAGLLLFRLFGNRLIAGLGTLFLAVEPFLLAESRRAHTDALMSLFLYLALLLWLCYLESKTFRCRDLILSGICFAFACLTKSLACAFLLFLPLILGWYLKQRRVPWAKLIWSAVLWIMSVMLTVLVGWPYLWTFKFSLWNFPIFPILFVECGVLLIWSIRKLRNDAALTFTWIEGLILSYGLLVTVSALFFAVASVVFGMHWAFTTPHGLPTLFLGEIRYNPGMLYFPVMWFVWSTPLTFPFIGFAMFRGRCSEELGIKTFRVAIVLCAFVLFYLIGLSFTAKKISRYIVIFLPATSLLTTLGAVQVAQFFKKKWLRVLFLIIVSVLQLVPILRLHPHYRAYYYPLLSGTWVAKNTSSITGAGLDLAADFLNALPNARELHVELSPFSNEIAYYFIGKTAPRNSDTGLPSYDYEVEYLYDNQILGTPVDSPPGGNIESANDWLPVQEHPRELEHVVHLNGIDYVWIYRVLE